MSSSDSDNSIDWLASDEDDYDSPKRLSPQQAEESPQPSSSSLSPSLSSSSSSSSSTSLSPSSSSSSSPSSSSSSSSVRESPTSRRRKRSGCCDCKDGGRCGGDADSAAAAQTSPVSPVQGFTSVCEQLPVESKRHSERKRLCEKTPADTEHELLSQKCAELQCYIPPLSSILRGLRSGRYSERLSSFQESVAMDRIQRIMGVLQNPHLSGHFLSIIMKIEEMLHSWFPHVRPNLTQTDERAPAKKQKQRHAGASPPPASPLSLCSSDSSTRLKWLHTSPICSLKTPQSTLSQPAVSASPPPPRCGQDVTQDSAVSSSTDPRSVPGRRLPVEPRLSRGPPPFKIRSPCLERLLQAKDSIIAPRTDGGWLS